MKLFLPGFVLVALSFVLQGLPIAYLLGDLGYWFTVVAIFIALVREQSVARL